MTAAILGWILGCHAGPTSAPPAEGELVVFAASSLVEVLPPIATASGQSVTFRFESSSKLAKQLESGQPADLFFSADLAWMEALAAQGLLAAGSRRDLAGNSLVLIVPVDASFVPSSAAALASPNLVHLAMAGENVPAGRYGRASLRALGAWDVLEPRLVSGDNVRSALGWVASGEAEAGVVYATDARAEPRVKVAFELPAPTHPPIVYPAAVLAASPRPARAAAFLDFCAGPEGRATFEAAGFLPPPPR